MWTLGSGEKLHSQGLDFAMEPGCNVNIGEWEKLHSQGLNFAMCGVHFEKRLFQEIPFSSWILILVIIKIIPKWQYNS